jgi:hypothetical protein
VRLRWSAEADGAFNQLKALFTDAPMLAHPDPSLAFIVEVVESEAGVGAVLSQRSGTPPKLRPCTFFSKKLGPAERNYDVGDWESLAMVKALKMWRHWLEGASPAVSSHCLVSLRPYRLRRLYLPTSSGTI